MYIHTYTFMDICMKFDIYIYIYREREREREREGGRERERDSDLILSLMSRRQVTAWPLLQATF